MTYSVGTFSIRGAGIDIWNTSDQFTFANRQVSGDVTIVARLATLQNVNAGSKAGVMIRQSFAAGSKYAFVLATPGNGVTFQRRTSTDGASERTNGGEGTTPVWLKLERRSSTFTAYRSANGTTWAKIGSATVSMGSTVYVGMAVTSRDAARTATATFSNVSVTAKTGNQPPTVSLAVPTDGATYLAPANILLAAAASDPDGAIARVDFYAGATLLGADTSSPYGYTWSGAPAGSYALTAVARDNEGGTTVSGTRDIRVDNPGLPRTAIFVPPANHSTAVDRYFLEIFPLGADVTAANPVATRDLGKPAIVNGECRVDVSQTIVALASGRYIATVTAIGTGGSAQSAASAWFVR